MSERDAEVSKMFQSVGGIKYGKLYSFELGCYDSIEFKGREDDILVFIHKTYIDDGMTPSASHWRRWPMSTFDLTGIKSVKVISRICDSSPVDKNYLMYRKNSIL